ncbi:MAG: DUF5686 family protein [Dysgonamonadaceae bacterium]|nr:DUF5686 family protein [Dysgonamonadaceae bacterium]MDD3309000.1 DUF5686 family protein [Dysgonamonadaceae bacterium]MDD3900499.1 DUF5686 family protein [Dysgonamonadaceae bacterium]MDD4399151.1 DUF5686 family protein [Dysgonamonadaceae bacterium]MEA5081986.1 DUF5686 family protein [Dysgonamonadaceae bacterium]
MKILWTIVILTVLYTTPMLAQYSLSGDSILKKAMQGAERYNGLVEKYKADVYMRSYIQTIKKNSLYKYTHLIPNFILHDPNSDEVLIETISKLKYDYPKSYVQDIKYVTGTLTKKGDINMIPFNFLHINIYGETSNEDSFFMPLRFSTSRYYTYKLTNSYCQNDTTYYTFEYSPIYKNTKLIKGTFVIESGSWRVTQFTGEGIDLISDFSFEMTMGNSMISRYLPENIIIFHSSNFLGNVVGSRHLAIISYSEANLRQTKDKDQSLNLSDQYKVRLDSVPVYDDSTFWKSKRPIPLQAVENDILKNYELKKDEAVRKRQNGDTTTINKAKQLAQRIALSSNYDYKSTRITYSGLLNPLLIGYSSIDGVTYRQELGFDIGLKWDQTINMDAYVGYLFRRKELFCDITTRWNYNPAKLGSVYFAAGIGNPSYSSLFVDKIQESLQSEGLTFSDISVDFYKDYYFKLFNDIELVNGIIFGAGIDYHIRRGKSNSSKLLSAPIDESDKDINNMFGTRRTFVPSIRLEWTPQQYYRFEDRQKIYVRSSYPTFRFDIAHSFKNILGSSSVYNKFELDVSQNIETGLMKSFQYHVGAGLFTNQQTEYFADFSFFAKNNFPTNWDDGLGGGFNLLPREFYNASESYLQGHFMYETPFLLLRSIPHISKGVIGERLYISQLYTPRIKSYTELGYGIGNRVFNLAVFASFHKQNFRRVGIKAALEF